MPDYRQLIKNIDLIENSITSLREISESHDFQAISLNTFITMLEKVSEETFSDVTDLLRAAESNPNKLSLNAVGIDAHQS